jgi:prepilin-type N-terminal cleavage/methylation domain-containing protein
MRPPCLASVRRRLAGERGFTLIELLAAASAGLVVSGAALAILVTSVHFSTGDSQRVDADQQGSVAMEKIVQALASSCVQGVGVSPIVGVTGTSGATGSTAAPPSSNNSITFYSSLTDSPVLNNPSEIRIYLSANNGPLDLSTYAYSTGPTGTTGLTGTYGVTPTSTFVLLSHAAPPGSTAAQASSTPIFTYSGYDPSSGSLADQFSSNPSLGATNAAATSEVGINFQAQPGNGANPANGSIDLADSVVLRLTSVSNYPSPGTGSTGVSPCA